MRRNREDKLARFEWTSNGSLGRGTIGKVYNSLVITDSRLTD